MLQPKAQRYLYNTSIASSRLRRQEGGKRGSCIAVRNALSVPLSLLVIPRPEKSGQNPDANNAR